MSALYTFVFWVLTEFMVAVPVICIIVVFFRYLFKYDTRRIGNCFL